MQDIDIKDRKMNDTVGIFYETLNGEIVYVSGFEDYGKIIIYYFDDDKGIRKTDDDTFQTWKARRDLKDFPNAKDPRLPYVFDLWWDIKHLSQLRFIINNKYNDECYDINRIKELMVEHNIKL